MGKARTTVVRVAFNAGEFAPKLDARVDLEKAQFASRTMFNTTVFHHGGTKRRPGLRFVASLGNVSVADFLLAEDSDPLLAENSNFLEEE